MKHLHTTYRWRFVLCLSLVLLFFSPLLSAQQEERFAELDAYAEATPLHLTRSVDTLVSYLMIPARNETEKAWLIYSWIAHTIRYDDGAYNSKKTADFSSVLVLKKKKAVCIGYAMLFEAMGTEAGLNVRTVIGYSKPMKRGKKMKNPDHAWNAVEADGRWMLCDATWGGSYATIHGGGKIKSKKQFTGFWFDTPPHAFVLTHLPDVNRWQLLSTPVTKRQFENFPIVSQEFFDAGFSIDTIMDDMLAFDKFKVVQVFPTKGKWTANGAPENGLLEKGKEYRFTITTPDYDAVMVMDGTTRHYFTGENGQICVSLQPQKRVSVFLFHSQKRKKGEGILVYEVAR